MIPTHGWPAPAKLNLFLHVVGRRADGYHLLETLFQFVDRADQLDFRLRADGELRRLADLPGVAPDADLVLRAARALQAATGTRQGADIRLHKRLPMGAGLGGGSSNAATALVALNALWGTGLDTGRLAEIGLGLGADVPVFVHGRAAWAEGVGEILTPFEVEESAVVVLTPDCAVATAEIFKDPDLTRDTRPITMPAFSLARTANDCLAVTRRRYPAVAEAFDWLSRYAEVRMSGTGASVFAFFAELAAAEDVVRQVPAPWQAFAAMRRNRSPLLEFLDGLA
jgi:4-diphosphocytidyl-2-C-methyl-D-erythritol kinase